MAIAITNLSGFPLEFPSDGRLQIRNITTAMMPGSVPFTLSDFCSEFHFNPILDLSSPGRAFSFLLGRLAAVNSQVDTGIAYPIAAFAFDQVGSRNWVYGLSLSVVLETIYVFEEPRSHVARADFLDDHLILNFASSEVDHGNEYKDATVGMSEHEISQLKTEPLSHDEDESCCNICLEGFMRGNMITQLSPCMHRLHKGCVVLWLRKNRTCPICRAKCKVDV